MAQRIYSLAKELDIDSKELVELCPKAGIQGKGSALASLTDEEVTKLRAYLDNASSRATPAARMPAAQPLRPVRTLPSAAARKSRSMRDEGDAVAVEDGPPVAVAEDTSPVETGAIAVPPYSPPRDAESGAGPGNEGAIGSAPPVVMSTSSPGASPPPAAASPRGPLLSGANQGQLRNLAARVR